MGISPLKPVLRNIGNSPKNRQKNVEKFRQKREVNLKKNEEFFYSILFSIKKRTYRKNAISKILRMFRDISKNGFSAMKLILIAKEYYAYNSVPSVESIKLLAIIEAKRKKV